MVLFNVRRWSGGTVVLFNIRRWSGVRWFFLILEGGRGYGGSF